MYFEYICRLCINIGMFTQQFQANVGVRVKTSHTHTHTHTYIYIVFWNIWFKTLHVSNIFVYSQTLLIWFEVLPTSYEKEHPFISEYLNKYSFMSTWCFICYPLCRMHVLLHSFEELPTDMCVHICCEPWQVAKNPWAYVLCLSNIIQYVQFVLYLCIPSTFNVIVW